MIRYYSAQEVAQKCRVQIGTVYSWTRRKRRPLVIHHRGGWNGQVAYFAPEVFEEFLKTKPKYNGVVVHYEETPESIKNKIEYYTREIRYASTESHRVACRNMVDCLNNALIRFE